MIILERMNQNHITQVYDLEMSCFAIPWSLCSLYDQLLQPAACYFVALDCDKVVGYGGFVQVLDEGNINNIAVLPEYRQQKIGTEILEKLIAEGNKLGVKDFFWKSESRTNLPKHCIRTVDSEKLESEKHITKITMKMPLL